MSDASHTDTGLALPAPELPTKLDNNKESPKCCGDTTCGCDGTSSSSIPKILRPSLIPLPIKTLAWKTLLELSVLTTMIIFTTPMLRRLSILASAMVSVVFSAFVPVSEIFGHGAYTLVASTSVSTLVLPHISNGRNDHLPSLRSLKEIVIHHISPNAVRSWKANFRVFIPCRAHHARPFSSR